MLTDTFIHALPSRFCLSYSSAPSGIACFGRAGYISEWIYSKQKKTKSEVLLVCQGYVLQTLVTAVASFIWNLKRLGWEDQEPWSVS